MEKLKFEKLSQFISALEEGPLYDENSVRYVLEKIPTKINALAVVEYGLKNRCVSCNDSLLSAQENSIAHTFTRQKPIPDKTLVWCWDNTDIAYRAVRFYNAKDECVFHIHGYRDGASYDNYEVIEPNEQGIYEHPFDWANEAVKKLEN